MFIARRPEEPPARFGGAELNVTHTNLVSSAPPNRAGVSCQGSIYKHVTPTE